MKKYNLSKFSLPENTQELSEKNKKDIAVRLKSLPEYIYLIKGGIYNLLGDAKDKNSKLPTLLTKYPINNLEIEKLYYSYKEPDAMFNEEFLNVLGKFQETRERVKYRNNIERKVKELQRKNRLSKENNIKWTNFSTEKLRININVNTKNELGNVFNTFVTSPEIPFAYLKRKRKETMYKIFLNYSVPKDWSVCPENLTDKSFILLKFVKDFKQYDIVVFVTKEEGLSIKVNVGSEEFYKKFIESTLYKALKIDQDSIEIKKDNIRCKAEYNIPSKGKEKQINKYVLLDQIFNNQNFSDYLCVNEFEKASKEKTVIFAYFSEPGAEAGEDKRCPGKSIIITPHYDSYTGKEKFIVTIKKAKNQADYTEIFDVMGRLFYEYTNVMPKIVEIYRKYIPKFGKEKKVAKTKKKIKMGEIDSLLYDTKYNFSRLCQKGKPKVLTNRPENFSEGKIYENGVLKFPNTNFTTEFGTIDPKYYDCSENKKNYNHVGLIRVRDTDHPTKYLPCCFVKKQDNKEPFKTYTQKGVEYLLTYKPKVKTKQIRISDTDKFATQKFKKFESSLNTDSLKILTKTESEFLRYGVYKDSVDPNSFIHCVCEAYDPVYKKKQSWGEKQNYVEKKRREYAKKDNIALCKQQLYDKNFEEIETQINNTEEYFDPELFFNFLQYSYQVNIFIFKKNKNKIELVIPRSQNGYYFSFYDNSMFIYLNYGSQSLKKITYPQCEIISPWDREKEVPLIFNKKINIDFYLSLNKGLLVKNKSVKFLQEFHVIEKNFTAQALDNSGKTRFIKFTYGNTNGVLLTSPIEPLRLKVVDNPKITKTSITEAENFLKHIFGESIQPTYCVNSKKEVNYVKIKKNGIIIEIPVISEKSIEGRAVCVSRMLPETTSRLSVFESTRKLSVIIKNYFLWLYSKYGENMDIKSFAKKHTEIVKPYRIKEVDNRFSESSSIIKDKKLEIDSKETRKRLEYFLNITMMTRNKQLMKLHEKVFIEDYYLTKSDFTQNSQEIIIEGENSFLSLMSKKNTGLVLHSMVIPDMNEVYFLKNSQIESGKLCLCFNTQDLNDAIYRGVIWSKKGFNPVDTPDKKYPKDFKLYTSSKEGKIILNYIGKGGDKAPAVFGYLLDGKPAYTAMLKI